MRAGSSICAVFAAAILTLLAASCGATEPVATFSIVAFDEATGELGVAVQSKFFAVGAVVPWARAGVGAIASQAFGNTTFGPRGLDLIEKDLSLEDVLSRLLTDDEKREVTRAGCSRRPSSSSARAVDTVATTIATAT